MKKFNIKEFNKLLELSDLEALLYIEENYEEKEMWRKLFISQCICSLIKLNNCIVLNEKYTVDLINSESQYYNIYIELKILLFTEMGLKYNNKTDKWE